MNPTQYLSRFLQGISLYWDSEPWKRYDWISPLCMYLLTATGIIFIYSAQNYTGGDLWLKQIGWLAVSSVAYFIIALMNYRLLFEYSHYLYIISIALLLLVETPLGTEIYGARRWIDLKVFTFQPTEVVKLTTLILIARILSRFQFKTFIESSTAFLLVILITGIPTFIVFSQPDLGSSLILPIMTTIVLYSAGFSRRFFQICGAALVLAISVLSVDLYRYDQYLQREGLTALTNQGGYESQSLLPLKDYQRNRLMAFVAPDRIDPQGLGVTWNVRHSLISIGTGGTTGKGWNDGTHAKLGYLPEGGAHNDFIFSVIAEETGFLGGTLIIGLFAVLIFNGIRISQLANDRFGQMLAIGISTALFAHIFVNVGMTMGLAPVTGLPLPFLSHGGTFLLSCFMLLAIQQSIYRFRETSMTS